MPLDPAAGRLLKVLAASRGDAGTGTDAISRRRAFDGLMQLGRARPPDIGVVDIAALSDSAPVRLRRYGPPLEGAARAPALVYLHGGGLMAGSLETHDGFCRQLAQASGCVLIAVDYRLAPEHPCPGALEDALRAMRWCRAHAAALGVDPRRLGLAGDSAGAHLAAVTCQRLCALGDPPPALQLLICPIVDLDADTPSRRSLGSGYLLELNELLQQRADYLPAGHEPAPSLIAPLRAGQAWDLPPTFIHAAEYDPMRDEAAAYAQCLREQGVEVHYTCHPGMIHLFYALGAFIPYAAEAIRAIGAEIAGALMEDPCR